MNQKMTFYGEKENTKVASKVNLKCKGNFMYFGSVDFFCVTATKGLPSFLIRSVDDVAMIGTTATGFTLGAAIVTGGVHIGIFFGSSVNTRRHLNQRTIKGRERTEINFLRSPPFAVWNCFVHL